MTQRASQANLYATKDQDTAVMLLTVGLPISETTREGRRVTFYFDKREAAKYIKLWTSGKPIPISDIRDVFKALRIFHAAVHDEIR